MSRGWAISVQGGTVSDKTKKRQKWEFWILLGITYTLMFGITFYSWIK